MFDSQNRKIHFGLLIMRLGLTAVLFLHALPKLFDGAYSWKSVGTNLDFINIGLPPMIFGFAILLLETLGAVSFVFGYFFRAACTLLFILFGLYFLIYFQKPGYDTLMLWSLGLAAVFFGLIYIGPGRYSIAVKLEKK
jgi:putative oxidoreductase